MVHPRILRQNLIDQLDEAFLRCNHQNGLVLFFSIDLGSLGQQYIYTVHVAVNLGRRIAPLHGHMQGGVELPRIDLLLLGLQVFKDLCKFVIQPFSGSLLKLFHLACRHVVAATCGYYSTETLWLHHLLEDLRRSSLILILLNIWFLLVLFFLIAHL